MTMPHLMNCSHSSDGWCLDCVKELHDECQAWKDKLQEVVDLIDDILFDSSFRPVDSEGNPIKGNDYYLVEHPVQEHHMPALRQWFVKYQDGKG